MQNFEKKYRMRDGETRLDAAFFNPVHVDVDLRLHALETVKASWEDAVDEISAFGLKRIDDVLKPTLQGVQELAELGFLVAPVTTMAVYLQPGAQSVRVDAGPRRRNFYASPFVALTVPGDWRKYAIARVLSYDRETGVLDLHVLSVNGGDEGPFYDVQIANVAASVPATETLTGQAQDAAQAAVGARTEAVSARDSAARSAKTATDAAAALRAAQAEGLTARHILASPDPGSGTLYDARRRDQIETMLDIRLL